MNRPSTERSCISLVLVSHSRQVALGTAELVAQVAGTRVPVFAIGGTQSGGLGTDGQRVFEALRCALCTRGAVVLADIGSSVLAVQAAIAELDPAQRASVILADAPFVEGAIAAAVSAANSASLEQIACAAEEARRVRKL